MEKIDDTRLSYSSANTLKGCERRYYHYKVAKTPYDSDYEEDVTSLIIGKSFHFILESTLHRKPDSIDEWLELCTENFKLDKGDWPLVHAMIIKYLRLHKKVGLECISVEDEVSNEFLLGYIDAVMKDSKGGWWIVDLKTAATFNQFLKSRLTRDTQLSLYAAFAPDLAKKYSLDLKKFKGTRYRLTTKSKATQKAGEDRVVFTSRMVELIKSHDIEIPIGKMDVDSFIEKHKELWQLSLALRNPKEMYNGGDQNFSNCDSFFRPCPYWSKCYGKTFTELSGELKQVTV